MRLHGRDTYPHVTDMVGGGPFRLRPGEWTDDTSMALRLADSLIAKKGVIYAVDLADRFVRWWKQGENSLNGRCFDIDDATRAAGLLPGDRACLVGTILPAPPATAALCFLLRQCWRRIETQTALSSCRERNRK